MQSSSGTARSAVLASFLVLACFGPAAGHVVLDGLADLTIEGNGCTLVFEAIKTGVFVKDCNRLLVRNVNMDWSRLLSSAGVVEEKDGKKFVRIAPEYDVAGCWAAAWSRTSCRTAWRSS